MGAGPDDLLVFKTEDGSNKVPGTLKKWKILVVDDEQEVHAITTLVLREFSFEGRGIEFLHAYSSIQAREILDQHKGIALILLDVVMESDHAGLDLVHWIRNERHDKLVRIILRTGQPGMAPEKQVITKYDINDYKEKTELTDTKLWTTITVALRGYRDLCIINRSREGLEKIVEASIMFSERQSLSKFFQGVLTQLTSLLRVEEDSMMISADGIAIQGGSGGYRIVSATGAFENLIGKTIDAIEDPQIESFLRQGILRKQSFFDRQVYLAYMVADDGSENMVLLRSPTELLEEDREMIRVFSSNASIALVNVSLIKNIEDSQSEMIFTLGEVVESRSIETGYHVRRVAAIAALLAQKCGFSEREVEMVRFSVPLHDIGKIGIGDAVLNKPGPLDDKELIEMRKHTLIGYNLLRGGTHRTLQMAASIALTHHERWDGLGYPQGLKGGDIPLVGRITCIADVFDALVNSRIYKPAWLLDKVVEYINDQKGRQFDPALVDLFNSSMDDVLRIMKDFREPGQGKGWE